MRESAAKIYSEKVLGKVRDIVKAEGLDENRLPRWVNTAKIKFAHTHGTNIFYIRPKTGNEDEFTFYPEIEENTELFLDIDVSTPRRAAPAKIPPQMLPEGGSGFVVMDGGGMDGSVNFDISSTDTVLWGLQFNDYNAPILMVNIYLQFKPEGNTVETSFVPLALFVNDSEFQYPESHLKKTVEAIYQQLRDIHDTDAGDYYENESLKRETYHSRIDNSVIVLGAYDGGDFETELEQVRDFLNSKGLNASLIKDLPGHHARSVAHKVKTWSMSSKFVIVVDREASGHLVEYSDLKGEEIPIVLLREEDSGSTFLAGHEYLTRENIQLFEFEQSPIEPIEDALEWVDRFTEKQREQFTELYPWRENE